MDNSRSLYELHIYHLIVGLILTSRYFILIGRSSHSSVLLRNGNILVMGGGVGYVGGYTNDVWQSTDSGVTWIQLTANAAWGSKLGLLLFQAIYRSDTFCLLHFILLSLVIL